MKSYVLKPSFEMHSLSFFKRLKKEREVSFEEVILCIEEGRVLAILEHPILSINTYQVD